MKVEMRKSKLALVLLLVVALGSLSGFGQAQAQPSVPTLVPVAARAIAVPAAPQPSPAMNAAVDTFLSTVPDSFYAVGTIAAVKDMMANGGAVLYDLRGPEAYNAGHIPGAVNLPIRTLAQNLDKIPTDKPVLLSCGGGYLAAMGLAVLQTLGYHNVKAFPGSYDAWTAAHEPVSQDAVPPTVYGPPVAAPALIAQADTFLRSLPDDFLGIGTVPALKEAMANGALLVDVRPAGMYGEGHIPGAINIPIQQLPADLDKIPRDKPVVVSCGSGYLTGMALAALQLRGYTNVRSFPPSYDGWKAANQPVEK
jgi:rhodanese-related sulfurtransferase